MNGKATVVITGLGIVGPLGIGREAVCAALDAGRTGLRRIESHDVTGQTAKVAGVVVDFDPLLYVKPRKALKVMARDSQLTIAAASLAREDARLASDGVDPERFGVIMGADVIRNPMIEVAEPFMGSMENGEYDFSRWGQNGMRACFPLVMLKLLPNMPACHVSIAHDARGPNNTICMAEASSLSALGESQRLLERNWADVMLAGGVSSRINPYDLLRSSLGEEFSPCDDPARASRPFDADRDGQVRGEGATILVLERRDFAAKRGAAPLAEIRGWGSAHEHVAPGGSPSGQAVRTAIGKALQDARLSPSDVGFVSAHGLATRHGDLAEAKALRETIPGRPVFAPKSYGGNLGAGCGAIESALAVLALSRGRVPPTLHCDRPDPACGLTILREPLANFPPTCVVVNYTPVGQAVAMVLAAP